MLQTILGANGVIATEIAKALPRYTQELRLVSRKPRAFTNRDRVSDTRRSQ
jgi:hypothetical protein